MARSLNPSGFLFEKNDIYDSFFISLYEPTPLLQLQLLIPPPHIIDFTKIYNQIFMYFFLIVNISKLESWGKDSIDITF